jgi:uncharacterized membrane protein
MIFLIIIAGSDEVCCEIRGAICYKTANSAFFRSVGLVLWIISWVSDNIEYRSACSANAEWLSHMGVLAVDKKASEKNMNMNINKWQGPAAKYSHQGHDVKNVNNEFRSHFTKGQLIADWIAKVVGSWPFIIYQSIIIVVWLAMNVYLVYMATNDPTYFQAWDPYPFILLNLVLSFQAAYTGPVVMMSQNRQAEKDRLAAEQDYQVNKTAEEEIKILMEHLVHQDIIMAELIAKVELVCQKS